MGNIVVIFQFVVLLGVCVGAIVGIKKKMDKSSNKRDNFSSPVFPVPKYASDDNSSVAVSPMPEYDLTAVKENYYRLRNQFEIPSGCMRIDMETTVFGFPCRTRVNGQYFKYGFYCWIADDTLYIFPTEDHLKNNYITYSMNLYGEDTFDSNDIPLYQIKKSAIIRYRIIGEIHSEKKIKTNDVGQYERDKIVGRIIAESTLTFIDTVDDKNRYYTRVRKIDERCVELSYYDGTQSHNIILGFGVYQFLKQNFPDKEYDHQETKQKVSLAKSSVTQEEFTDGWSDWT
ncbi:MAG: hypothetical protein IJU14_03730 [Clostridia bacterium]|nr:hypothetical protein [Clostridia bacterium]